MVRHRLVVVVLVIILGGAVGQSIPAQATGCTPGPICVTVDTTTTTGPAKLRAQGFLNGITDQTPMALLNALKPQFWRAADTAVYAGISQYDRAKATGAVMDYTMNSDWVNISGHYTTAWTCQPGVDTDPGTIGIQQPVGIKPAYVDFNEYDAYLDSFIAAKIAAGKNITYWEPENEPDITGCVYGGRYKNLRYEQFRRAYQKVMAAVPGAKVTAPSIDVYAGTHALTGCRPSSSFIDLTSMLDHARDNNIQYGAIAWHEISDPHACDPPLSTVTNPPVIIDHMDEARALIAARQPQVGNPEIVINEWGTQATWMLPGWSTGFIAALEKGNVDRASRSCWPDENQGGTDACFHPSGVVGGLFTTSQQPQANYWVHLAYADMSCPDATCAVRQTTRVGATSNDLRVTGFATRDDVLSKVHLLVGRHVTCTKAVNVAHKCVDPISSTPAPAGATIDVAYPYGGSTAYVTVKKIPNVRGAVAAPAALTGLDHQPMTVTGGHVSFTIPSFADGESYIVTVSAS